LRDQAEGDVAGGLGTLPAASQFTLHLADRSRELVAIRVDAGGKTARFQCGQPGVVVVLVADRLPEFVAIARAVERGHDLDVLHVIALVLSQLIEHHGDEMRARGGPEPVEGREEFVVAGRDGGRRQECAHRERVDQAVVELLVAPRFGCGHGSPRPVARRLQQRQAGEIHAQLLRRGPRDEAFGVDRAPQVGVKVAAFRHPVEKGAQRGPVLARLIEARRGNDRVELARDDRRTDDGDDGRQKNDGKDDPASHGLTPALTWSAEASACPGKVGTGFPIRTCAKIEG